MSDEHINSAWGYCTHPIFWYQGYWCCLDEQCEYRYEPVPTCAYDPAGHDGYSLATGPDADGENSLGDETFGHGEATAYDVWGGDHQPGSEQGQDAFQYVQQYDNYQQDGYQHGGYLYGGYQDDVGQGDYGYPPNAEQPVPPSDAATTGSGSSATQTHSPSSTETPDNEDASMAGNADENTEDMTWAYVQEDNRDGQDIDEAMNLFPEYPVVDTHYPSELSIENESESLVDQSNIEERPDLGPR
ncbi:hypothetical protein NCS52_00235900 [Fusarium sp. LHS14.1]|nr:hypothetical protein NCS52_00235900 [Fusarium sp. LHS14.1]